MSAAACPPTPVVRRRRAQRLPTHPYMRFQTDFRGSFSDSLDVSLYPSFQRAISIEISGNLDASVPETRPSRTPSRTSYPSSPAPGAFVKSHSFPPIATHSLERIDESDVEDNVATATNDTARSSSPVSSSVRSRLASPSTRPRWVSNYRIVPPLDSIEEYELEDGDDADPDPDARPPPVSSSPGRSSDDDRFFPFDNVLSSPRTSDHGHDNDSQPDPDAAPADPVFSSKLIALLAVAAQHRERHHEIDNDESATLGTASLSVTPDYCASPTPQNGWQSAAAFGPRRTDSWSTGSSGSVGVQSCTCSRCRSESASTRTASIRSTPSYSGYAADLDDPASPSYAPRTIAALTHLRASNSASTPTQRLADISNSTLTPTQRLNNASPFPAKRTYSARHDDIATLSSSHKKSKLKLTSRSSSSSFSSRPHPDATSTPNPDLSRVPASLRKSISLRSDASKRSPSPKPLIPTELNTPLASSSVTTGRVILDPDLSEPWAIPFDVPVIAPPPGHMARLPLGAAACAKIRIGNLLAREARARAADRLDGGVTVSALVSAVQGDGYGHGHGYAEREEAERALERLRWEHVLGVGPELRREVVEWILDVLPKKSTYLQHPALARTASPRRAVSPNANDGGLLPDLVDQLLYSPETRFHAGYMFLRYFFLLMGDAAARERIEGMQAAALAAENEAQVPFGDPTVPAEGWSLVVWDCCLACLAISVKMHRDVLEPLEPVLSWEFEALAPHHISFDELETAQRDVLETFNWSLGDTPQPILDELWLALPSLQQLLDFENGWRFAQKEAWWRLNDALLESDILNFPISLLTVAALAEALVAALVSKYEYDASHTQVVGGGRRHPGRYSAGTDSKNLKKREMYAGEAEVEMEGVVQDVQAVIGISDERLGTCRRWLRAAIKN
ncbi:hypothetical protein C8R46DRAFT_1299604 [Mycena filopes]|nr:hypothetical protein C8R46DRAFT_1299604 [Mycena filopes]